jgi:DNA polymerase III epsilon subunit-like protein
VEKFVEELSNANSYLILDTETTGIKGEIIELTIINSDGKVLFNSFIRPKNAIELDAIKVHHITEDMCKNSPEWPTILPTIKEILSNQIVVTYNALFDRRAFHKSDQVHGLQKFDWKSFCKWRCAMYATADFLCLTDLRWIKLKNAAEILKIDFHDINFHSALGDTTLALRVTKYIIEFFSKRPKIQKS